MSDKSVIIYPSMTSQVIQPIGRLHCKGDLREIYDISCN